MKATLSRDVLADAAKWVARAIDPRSAAPDMLAMAISAEADRVELHAANYDSTHRCTLPAQVGEPGKALVPGLALTPFLLALKGAEVELALDGAEVVVQSGAARSRLRTFDAGYYPPLPETGADEGITVEAEELASVIGRLLPLASRESVGDPWQEAFHLVAEDTGQLYITAGTRYALGRSSVACQAAEGFEALVPARMLSQAVQELSGPLTLSVLAGSLLASTEGRTATVRLYDLVVPPQISPMLDPPPRSTITLNRDALASALKLVATATDRVRLDFQADSLTVSGFRPEKGEARSEITDVIECTADEPAEVVAALEYLNPIMHGLTEPEIELVVPAKGLGLALRDSGARFVFMTIKPQEKP